MRKISDELFDSKENLDLTKMLLGQNEQILEFALFDLMEEPKNFIPFEYSRYTLINKMLIHCSTIHQLANGKLVTNNGRERVIYDKDSIFLIQRTILENYITFNALYLLPETEEAKQFRYNIYSYVERKAQYERNKALFEDDDHNNMNNLSGADQLVDKNLILDTLLKERDIYYEKITEDSLYSELSRKQIDKLTGNVVDWKIDGSWYDLAKKVKFNEFSFSYNYNILSSSAHSGLSSSLLNNDNNLQDKEYLTLIFSTLVSSIIVISRAILEYLDVIGKKSLLNSNEEIFNMIQTKAIQGIQINIFAKDDGLMKYFEEY